MPGQHADAGETVGQPASYLLLGHQVRHVRRLAFDRAHACALLGAGVVRRKLQRLLRRYPVHVFGVRRLKLQILRLHLVSHR